METLGAGATLIIVVIVFVGAILLFFLPFFVYRIRNEIITLNKYMEAINTNMKAITKNVYICGKSLQALTINLKPVAKPFASSKDKKTKSV